MCVALFSAGISKRGINNSPRMKAKAAKISVTQKRDLHPAGEAAKVWKLARSHGALEKRWHSTCE